MPTAFPPRIDLIPAGALAPATFKVKLGLLYDAIVALLGTDGEPKTARALLGVAPRATRIDVASVAGTVDLTVNAPDTDDIRITGALAITKFTVAIGRVIRVTAGGAFTLANNSDIVTQTGATLTLGSGDTFELRATAANVVEVRGLARATPPSATAASQSEMEAGSSGAVFVTPANIKWAPGVAKAWACVTQSGGTYTLAAALSISSLAKVTTGTIENNFTTAMSSTAYAAVASAVENVAFCQISRATVRATVILLRSSTEALQEAGYTLVVFGDQ